MKEKIIQNDELWEKAGKEIREKMPQHIIERLAREIYKRYPFTRIKEDSESRSEHNEGKNHTQP
ncbi:hypothetical protein J9317_16665 [Metabacillus sp. KIGAM252]|uniref:Uncharacterized protein n=1 Tax=Metabacillus flavus TaxID=2823519 RepID=A0ABS5LHZ9_9BACI|nr:hypothetical protein [Metabacillus flavus]MBS2970381.1 hypothetical protein [Metabacillus flavus]